MASRRFIYCLCLLGLVFSASAQDLPETAKISAPSTNLWLNSYGKIRITDKLFWDAQVHYRRAEHNNISYIGRSAQLYNRHGISYMYTKKFTITLGGVLRLNFNPDPGNTTDFNSIVLEPRIWHEYLFALPFNRFMVYHRVRIEHIWTKGNGKNADRFYRNRWRYKFYMNIPINRKKLVPGAFYFMPDIELIMQSGKAIVDNPMEELRLTPKLGYIQNPRIKYSFGMTYALGQTFQGGHVFKSRWLMLFNVYYSLDFRKFENKIPDINISD